MFLVVGYGFLDNKKGGRGRREGEGGEGASMEEGGNKIATDYVSLPLALLLNWVFAESTLRLQQSISPYLDIPSTY